MEWQLFTTEAPPEWTTPEWYASREAAPHLEQEGHRERLVLTLDMVNEAIRRVGTDAKVVDLGAGDGGLLSTLPDDVIKFGFDLQGSNVAAARRRRVDVRFGDVIAEWPKRSDDVGNIIVASEFLEHLVDPHDMVRRIRSSGASFLIASSPYTETGESHYEFHTWAWDEAGYRALLEDNGWNVLRQERAWISQVLLAERA